jgi:competence protein ComEC
LGRPLAWVAWPFAAFTNRAVEYLAGWPAASIPLGPLSPALLAALALVLLAAGIRIPRPSWLRDPLPPVSVPKGAVLLGLALLTSLAWREVAARPEGLLSITVLDVGEGDAVLIQSPTGRRVLLDGGPSPIALSEGMGQRLPLLDRGVDWLVLGGTAYEQTAGLVGVTERFPPSRVLVPDPPGGSVYRRLMQELREARRPIIPMLPGHRMDLGGGAALEVLAVGSRGGILLVQHGRTRMLLAPGADPGLIQDLAASGSIGPVTAVLLADGGYAPVNPPAWLVELRPRVALISVQAGNRRGLPSPAVLETLAGTTVLRTDVNGWIQLTSDGNQLWVEVERTPPD